MCARLGAVIAVGIAATLAGCASSTPLPYRRTMEEAEWQPKGAFAQFKVGPSEYSGELLAVEPEAFVLETKDGTFFVPMPCAQGVTLATFDSHIAPVVTWGALGTLSTPTHGFWLVYTAPVWLIATSIAATSHSYAGQIQERWSQPTPAVLEQLRKWARFPQGLPSGYVAPSLAGSRTGVACGHPYALPERWFRSF